MLKFVRDLFVSTRGPGVFIFAAISMFSLLYLTELIPHWGLWFSQDISLRLMTDTLREGHLSLGSTLEGLRHDWVVAKDGLHQVWGLGVPFLRLPFELMASAVGFVAFPDRLVFLFYHLIASILLIYSSTLATTSPLNRFTFSAFSIFGVLVSPIFIALLKARMLVYEEVIAYASLAAVTVFSLLMMAIKKPNCLMKSLLCFFAGLIVLIRPTCIFYGIASILVLSIRQWQEAQRLRPILWGGALFLIGPLICMIFNQVRFGHPLEFGYQLSLASLPLNAYALSFESPFDLASFFEATTELLGSLFNVQNLNGYQFYQPNLHSWQAEALRFREYYFPSFSAWYAISLILGPGLLWWHRKNFLKQDSVVIILWSLVSFLMLFTFYLYSPSIASRYLVDFLPALGLLALGVMIGIAGILDSHLPRFLANLSLASILVLVLFSQSLDIIDFRLAPSHPKAAALDKSATAYLIAMASEHDRKKNEAVPYSYECQSTPPLSEVLRRSLGWNLSKDCKLAPVSQIVLTPNQCVSLDLLPLPDFRLEDLDSIRVKLDRIEAARSFARQSEDSHRMTFCIAQNQVRNQKFHLVTIAWLKVSTDAFVQPRFRLERIISHSESSQTDN